MSGLTKGQKVYRLVVAVLVAAIILVAVAGLITLYFRVTPTASQSHNSSMSLSSATSLQAAYYLFTLEGDNVLKPIHIQRRVSQDIEGAKNLFNELLNFQGQIGFGTFSLIPPGTKLLSINIEGDVLFLNFSEEFQFNSWGSQGYDGQLEQVLRSASTLNLANYVQILIESRQLDFLHEGVYIGRPLALNID